MNLIDITAGQVWIDCETRRNACVNRFLTVQSHDAEYVFCLAANNGRPTRIRRNRFYPNAKGYLLIHDPDLFNEMEQQIAACKMVGKSNVSVQSDLKAPEGSPAEP